MSELVNIKSNNEIVRNGLLLTASLAALMNFASAGSSIASSDDLDHPTVWIEIGGQLERADNGKLGFAPPFFSEADPAVLAPLTNAERRPNYSVGEEASIAFTPSNSDWIIAASVRYGRANGARRAHYQSPVRSSEFQTRFGRVLGGSASPRNKFGDGESSFGESHLVVDFQAGKDVGLGLFGSGGSSVLSAGVRFAQFTSKANVSLHAEPVYVAGPFYTNPHKYTAHLHARYFKSNTAVLQTSRSTNAVGPSADWAASLSLAGNAASMNISLDWGVNAAILFGRQRTRAHHETEGHSTRIVQIPYISYSYGRYTNLPANPHRARNVTIPNLGGFAGFSLKFPNAKISLGYRGDFFFGATDNGIDTRKSTDERFYGPFANITIGLGG